jgi:hypothetical protein
MWMRYYSHKKERGDTMSYQEELKEHLIAYKHKHLGSPPAGTYRHLGQELSYEHILPNKDKGRINFLEESRDHIKSFLESNRQIKLHKYFHHLNSSQAFALNLFVPFFEGGAIASSALLNALGQRAELTNWELEAVPDTAEGTNLDAVWETTDGTKTICEVKLSENDFGKARPDDRHRNKLRDIYLPVLEPYLSRELQTEAGFFRSYQILRNVWHLVGTPNGDGRLVFLLPRGNSKLWPMLESTLAQISTSVREKIHCVAIEDVLDSLASNTTNPPHLRTYAQKLCEKYVPLKPLV